MRSKIGDQKTHAGNSVPTRAGPSRPGPGPWPAGRDLARAGTLALAGTRPGPGPKSNMQMTITPPSDGPRSSSRAHPIQVDHPGAHGTGPDRFRAVPDHFLMKTLTFV